MKWTLKKNRISFAADDKTLFSMKNLTGRVELNGTMTSADDCSSAGIRWKWEIREEKGGLTLKAVLENVSDTMIKIGRWDVLCGENKFANLGKNIEDNLFFRWRCWDIAVVDFLTDQDLDTTTLCMMTNKKNRHTLQIAFTTVDRMNVFHELKVRNQNITEMYARCEACDFRLQPGNTLESETLFIKYYDDPYTALEDWAEGIYQHYKPCFDGTMQAVFGYVTAAKREYGEMLPILAKKVKKHFSGFGKQMLTGGSHYIIKGGLPGNWLQFEENKDGLPYPELLKQYHKKGYQFKFWFSPFWFFGEAEETLKENYDNLLKDKDGKPITRPFKDGWELGRGRFGKDPLTKYFLDGTHPGTKKYMRKVFSEYRKMGCRGYMLDFLSSVPGAERYDETILPLQASREIFKEIRAAAGWDTHIQTAVASLPAFVGCINSARVVRDYGEGRPQHPFPNWRNSTHCRHDDHFANYHSFLQNAAGAYFTNYKVYVNDLNCLLLDHPVPADQARINVTMFGLSGDSPLSISDDLDRMQPERLRMLKMCFPRTKGIPKPVDFFDRTSGEGGCHILKKQVKTDYDDYMLAAVFNTAPDAPAIYSCRVEFARLGLDPEKEYRVYEFWNGEYCGTYKGSFPSAVPAADCRLYRICESREYPWLIGTDMHVEQGNCEVKNLKYNKRTRKLTGIACRPAGEQGRLVFLMPRNLKVAPGSAADLNTMKEVIDMQTVISLNLHFEKPEVPFELCFEEMHTEFVSRPGWLPYASESEWLDYVSAHKSDYDPCRVIK